MNIFQSPPLHLTYCLNVHPGQTWGDNFAAIKNDALRVRDMVCGSDMPFGLGMRLGQLAADELVQPEKLDEFRAFLSDNNLYVFTINGFPYGEFHDPGVKENVYAPDWRTLERRDYTIRLSDILAELLPDGVSGSISTVPGSYKPWIKSDDDVEAMVVNLADVATHLHQLRRSRGVSICLALEPEPDCFIETTKEVVAFFTGPLRQYGKARVRKTLNISGHKAAKLLRRHIGVCLDTAHAAVEFEDPAEAALPIRDENIRIAKVQLSSALTVTVPPAEPGPAPVMVSVSPVSGSVVSLANTFSTVGPESSATVKASSWAVGRSFTGVTVTVTVAVSSLPGVPSLIV